jgi:hypothetical protein
MLLAKALAIKPPWNTSRLKSLIIRELRSPYSINTLLYNYTKQYLLIFYFSLYKKYKKGDYIFSNK